MMETGLSKDDIILRLSNLGLITREIDIIIHHAMMQGSYRDESFAIAIDRAGKWHMYTESMK